MVAKCELSWATPRQRVIWGRQEAALHGGRSNCAKATVPFVADREQLSAHVASVTQVSALKITSSPPLHAPVLIHLLVPHLVCSGGGWEFFWGVLLWQLVKKYLPASVCSLLILFIDIFKLSLANLYIVLYEHRSLPNMLTAVNHRETCPLHNSSACFWQNVHIWVTLMLRVWTHNLPGTDLKLA